MDGSHPIVTAPKNTHDTRMELKIRGVKIVGHFDMRDPASDVRSIFTPQAEPIRVRDFKN